MTSQIIQPCSPADLWHDRLNQLAHRLCCLGWLILPTVWLPEKVAVPFVAAIVMCAAIVAVACSLGSGLLVPPDSGDRREAFGACAFSLVLLATISIITLRQHLQIKPLLSTWMLVTIDPLWLRWCLRGAAALLVAWIGIVTVLGRRGRA